MSLEIYSFEQEFIKRKVKINIDILFIFDIFIKVKETNLIDYEKSLGNFWWWK